MPRKRGFETAGFYAAGPRKQMAAYDADHGLHPPEVAADRVAWLVRELALKRTLA